MNALKSFSFIFISISSMLASAQDNGLLQLESMLGSWNHKAIQYRLDGDTTVEFGSMDASWVLDSTYIEIKCSLSGDDYTRYYSQYIGYDNSAKKFRSTYLYSGTMEKVHEDGMFDNSSSELKLAGVNPFSNEIQDGINIKSSFKVTANQIVLEVIELQADGDWKLGYKAIFIRKSF